MKKIISNKTDLDNYVDYLYQLDLSVQYIAETKRKPKHDKRSNKQNAYLHVCVSLFAIEFGYTLEEAKTHLKRNCHFMIYEKKGEKFLVHTSKQNSKELTDFIDWIRNYAAKQGCYLPTAAEYEDKEHDYDNIIEYNKQYL